MNSISVYLVNVKQLTQLCPILSSQEPYFNGACVACASMSDLCNTALFRHSHYLGASRHGKSSSNGHELPPAVASLHRPCLPVVVHGGVSHDFGAKWV